MLKLRNQMLEDYDIDLFENFIPSTFYLRSGLQICTGTKEFELSMPSAVQEIYGGMDAECKYVGPMLLSEGQEDHLREFRNCGSRFLLGLLWSHQQYDGREDERQGVLPHHVEENLSGLWRKRQVRGGHGDRQRGSRRS